MFDADQHPSTERREDFVRLVVLVVAALLATALYLAAFVGVVEFVT